MLSPVASMVSVTVSLVTLTLMALMSLSLVHFSETFDVYVALEHRVNV